MKTSTKVILGFVAGVVVAGLVVVALLVGGFAYIHKKTMDNIEATEKVRAAGTEFGKTTDQAGCIDKTFDLEAPFASFDYSRMFVAECLSASRPTPNFCDGVPPPLSDLNWEEESCRRIGRDTPLCHAAYSGKMWFCEKRNKK
jgi:hypothetical protein